MKTMDNERQRAVARARSQSKRHGNTMLVQQVVKGRDKGRYHATEADNPMLHFKDSVIEVVATYENGKRVPTSKTNKQEKGV